jgi:hypothetical protein
MQRYCGVSRLVPPMLKEKNARGCWSDIIRRVPLGTGKPRAVRSGRVVRLRPVASKTRAVLLGSEAHRRVPGRLSRRSIQFDITVAPRLPHFMHRMRGPKDGTVTSSGQPSTFTALSCPQCRQVACRPRTPWRRMMPERPRRRRAWLHRFSGLGTCRRAAGWSQKHTAASAHAESLNPSPT